MIRISRIYSDGRELNYYRHCVSSPTARFNIVGESGIEIKCLTIAELLRYNDIFGKVYDKHLKETIYLKTSNEAWSLFDYTDGIKSADRSSVKKLCSSYIDKYLLKDNVLIVKDERFHLPVDSNNIFWSITAKTNGYYTADYTDLFEVYKRVFNTGVAIEPSMQVYFYASGVNKLYRVDTNKDVIRYMTKLTVLRR